MNKPQPVTSTPDKEAAEEFLKKFIRLIAIAWIVPPVFAFVFFPVIRLFTLEQVIISVTTPLVPVFVATVLVSSLFYFKHYIAPVCAWIEQNDSANKELTQRRLRLFPLHFWGAFIAYHLLAPTVTIFSIQLYTEYTIQAVDLVRIYMVAVIVSIIAGLPAFFQIFDLFGRYLGKNLPLSRPTLTIKTRVFLIGALIPLLIDTTIVQYYWGITGYFGWDTFVIWFMLELLAIAGSLLFLRGFGQSLSPLHELLTHESFAGWTHDRAESLFPASTDELGFISARLAELLSELQYQHLQLDKTTQALQRREKYLSLTLNSIGDAVIVTDAEGYVSRMNPVAENLTGWSFSEAYGRAVKEIFPIIDASTRCPIDNPVEKVLFSGKTVFLSNHTTLISKNGSEYQIADSAAPIRGDNGAIQGMVLIFNDVTEQYRLREEAKRSRRNMQAILDNSPAVIFAKDLQGKYILANQQFAKTFKLEPAEITGKTDVELFSHDLAAKFQQSDRAALDAEHALESEESIFLNGEKRDFLSIKFPLMDHNDEIYAVCGILTDITERNKQQLQLRRSQKMDALGKLTGGVAHDYNNLLGIISGYAELLNEEFHDNPVAEKYALDIYRAAERGARLTKKLLMFSKHDTSEKEIIDINKLIKQLQLILEKSLTSQIRLKLDLKDNLWPVYVDSSDLEDAIINLSINAMHAMDKKGELLIETQNMNINSSDALSLDITEGEYVRLSIIDTGCGMNKYTLDRIFDPFFSTKGMEGTGLGLSQVYGFAEQSHCVIKVKSSEGEGSQFDLYFPRCNIKQSETADTDSSADTQGESGGRETLLIVDDEPAMLELANHILSNQGYRTLTAENGETALQLLAQESVDLILSDVIMPDMDGYQLAEQAQTNYPNIKILITSGFTGNRNRSGTDNFFSENILYKPFKSSMLLQRVRDLLDKNTPAIKPSKKTTRVLVIDDDMDVQELLRYNLEKLHYSVISATNSADAMEIYVQALSDHSGIDIVILDLNLQEASSGEEIARKLLAIDPRARIIISSGDSENPLMIEPEKYGFKASLEKSFNRDKLKHILEQVLLA